MELDDLSTSQRIARDLLEIGAVSFKTGGAYTWASGLRSPIYCDNRMTLGYPAVRRRIRDAFMDLLSKKDVHPDLLAGTATAGIPHAAWLAEALELPLVYVRAKAKEHGKGSRIEGPIRPGATAVVIEDLVSTGGSSVGVVEALREADVPVLAVCAIFSYGLQAAVDAFADAGVPLYTLTDFSQLLAVAERSGVLDEGSAESIANWRADPSAWSERFRATAEST